MFSINVPRERSSFTVQSFCMEVVFRGKGVRIPVWKIFLFFLLFLIAIGVAWFGKQTFQYYRAIKRGEVNPLLNQRLDASFSRLVANTNVTPEDLKRLVAVHAPSKGPENAKLTLVEFVDFDCPYSRQSFSGLRELMEKYQDRVRFVIRDFPLEELHPRAFAVAQAARCAHEQGKYWIYHDKLFAVADRHEDTDLRRYAHEADLNVAKFDACVAERKHESAVKGDLADGLKSGVEGTPTFFFNGLKVQGALNKEMLEFLIQKFLSQ